MLRRRSEESSAQVLREEGRRNPPLGAVFQAGGLSVVDAVLLGAQGSSVLPPAQGLGCRWTSVLRHRPG